MSIVSCLTVNLKESKRLGSIIDYSCEMIALKPK